MAEAAQSGPAETILQFCNGYRVSQALYVAAQLQIAEHLATCALSSAALAQATNTHAPSLRRLMRALTTLGRIFPPLFSYIFFQINRLRCFRHFGVGM
jgi:hypothetical protein